MAQKSVSDSPFDLVHFDVWDPAPIKLKGGNQYYAIFLLYLAIFDASVL